MTLCEEDRTEEFLETPRAPLGRPEPRSACTCGRAEDAWCDLCIVRVEWSCGGCADEGTSLRRSICAGPFSEVRTCDI